MGGTGTGGDNPTVHVSGYRGVVQQIAGDAWRVQSESSQKWYTVDLGVPKCDCTDWATKRNRLVGGARLQGKPDSSVKYECKHVRAAKEAARTYQNTTQQENRAALEKKTAKIKAEFAAQKTKKNALQMLKELGDM